ncbi:indoleacetamide hydrolase [Bordetella genomosp. 1]|nr:indoleacetamide hydrolase [Bordetella genomosp. 1]
MQDPGKLDATALLDAYRTGALTPAAYAEYVIDAAARERHLNALQHFEPERLRLDMESAARQGYAGALAAVPLVVKDNINTTGYPTSAGTRALLAHRPATDAAAVAALSAAGAVVGAKAGMHELAFGVTSNNAVTGAIRNPHDPGRIPGGSSGGTAAAIAAGLFPAGLGTDTGGSARIPAALCGIVGYRPTTGRYDGSGVVPISHTRDTVGPFARSVRDICLLDRVLSGEGATAPALDLPGIRLGVARTRFFDDLDPAVANAVQGRIDALARAGVRIVEVDLGEIWTHDDAFSFPVVFHEVMRDLPAYLAQHAPGVTFDALIAGVGSPDVAGALRSQLGPDATSDEVYRAAIEVHRPAMRRLYARAFETHRLDALVFPTTPITARPIGEDETVLVNGGAQPTFPTYIRNTDLASNLGAPGISLPCPVGAGELPVGIEFDGLPGQDLRLLALAIAVERVTRGD